MWLSVSKFMDNTMGEFTRRVVSLRTRLTLLAGVAALLSACQANAPSAGQPDAVADDDVHVTFEADQAWGGEVRCDAGTCRLVLVEHRSSHVSVYDVAPDAVRRLDRQQVAYHPDSAVWLGPGRVAAAVETSRSLDLFDFKDEQLQPQAQISIGFAPRDLLQLPAPQGHYRVLATPYRGTEVALVEWSASQPQGAEVQRGRWCEAPWHPVPVTRAPAQDGAGWAVGCLDDHIVVWVPQDAPLSEPHVLAKFNTVPRQVAPSPSGQWLYVALENAGRNARINMDSGEVQTMPAPTTGAVSAAPLDDDLVIWGDDQRVYLQQLDGDGQVQETRWLPTSGFATGLQLIDLDDDGELDLVVLNSADQRSDVIRGPLWERAGTEPIVPHRAR